MTTIKIATNNGDREVDAHVYGNWAAHKGHGRRGWSVTHVPSGRCLPDLGIDLGKHEACAIAKALHEQCDGSPWVGMPRTDDEVKATPAMEREGMKVRDIAMAVLRSGNG